MFRISLFFAVVLLAGCSSVTTYGFEPEEMEPGLYQVSLHYNAYASDADIDQKAAEIAERIRQRGGWESCEFSRSAKVSPATVKEIQVRINCDAGRALD